MRLRTLTASLVVAAAAALPLAGVAAAQPDRDCDDFSSQQEAQAALRPGDPDGLDDNDNGQACENYDYGSSSTPPADDDESAEEENGDQENGDDDSNSDSDDSGDDDNGDGFGDDDGQVAVVPRGGVDTGDGSSDPGPAPFLIAGAVATAVAAAAARRARTSR